MTGAPISGTLELVGVPFGVLIDELGFFAVQLPARTVMCAWRSSATASSSIRWSRVGEDAVERNYGPQSAPRILLIDGDAWAFSNALGYYRRALDGLGYLHRCPRGHARDGRRRQAACRRRRRWPATTS
ncbi:MAG: hypothetical protein U0470_04280 [Anaerolineae bacterium]